MNRVLTGIAAAMLLVVSQSCTNKSHRYVDLNTGTPFELVKDPTTGLMVDVETGKPLNIYIDLQKGDTIYGRTGQVINGKVEKLGRSQYVYMDWEMKNNSRQIAAGYIDAAVENEAENNHFTTVKSVE